MNAVNIRIIYLYHFVRGDEKFAYYFQPKGKLSEFFENDNRVGNIHVYDLYQDTRHQSIKCKKNHPA